MVTGERILHHPLTPRACHLETTRINREAGDASALNGERGRVMRMNL
jgi:hypothetical protein